MVCIQSLFHAFSTANHNPQHLLHYTSYHHRQLLLKATTSGTELITDLYPIVLDISQIRTLFRELYLKTCTERYAISISLSACLSLNLLQANRSFTAVQAYHRYTYVNQIGLLLQYIANNTTTLDFINFLQYLEFICYFLYIYIYIYCNCNCSLTVTVIKID